MSAPTPDHPLSAFAPLSAPGAVEMVARPHTGLLILRADPAAAKGAVAALDGLPLPESCGETGMAGAILALWLGPDEWMIVTPPGEEAAAETAIGAALDGAHHQLTEVSDHFALIAMDGPRATDLLAKLIALDLHPRAFPPARCASTLLAKAHIHLWRAAADAGDAPETARFRVIVRASHAAYVWRLLAEGAREWGVTPPPAAAPLAMRGTAPA